MKRFAVLLLTLAMAFSSVVRSEAVRVMVR